VKARISIKCGASRVTGEPVPRDGLLCSATMQVRHFRRHDAFSQEVVLARGVCKDDL